MQHPVPGIKHGLKKVPIQLMNDNTPLNLYFEEQGYGRPILLLHGFGASLFSWKYLARDLARDYRTISVDLKGFGRSPKPKDEAYSIADQAEIILDFVTRHDLQKMTLIGHSFGGAVALLTAQMLREQGSGRLSSLVLIDPIAYRQPLPIFIKLLRVPVLSHLILAVTPVELLVHSILKLAYFDERKISRDTVAAYAVPFNTAFARHSLVQTARKIIPPDIKEITAKYKSIDVPTLLVWGRHDKIVPIEMAERLHRDIPGSELVILESGGHIPQEEIPEETSIAVTRFLKTRIDNSDSESAESIRNRPGLNRSELK